MRSLPGGRISPVDLRKPPIAQQTTTTTAPPGNASTLSIASNLHDRSLNRSRSKFIWCAFCTSALPCQCCPTTLTQWTSSVANCHIAFMSAAFQAASHLSKTVRTFESATIVIRSHNSCSPHHWFGRWIVSSRNRLHMSLPSFFGGGCESAPGHFQNSSLVMTMSDLTSGTELLDQPGWLDKRSSLPAELLAQHDAENVGVVVGPQRAGSIRLQRRPIPATLPVSAGARASTTRRALAFSVVMRSPALSSSRR